MADTIKCFYMPAGRKAIITEIQNDLRTLQKAAGGYIEATSVVDQPDLVMLVDEEGWIKGKGLNVLASLLHGSTIVGKAVVARKDGEEIVSLTDDDCDAICDYLSIKRSRV